MRMTAMRCRVLPGQGEHRRPRHQWIGVTDPLAVPMSKLRQALDLVLTALEAEHGDSVPLTADYCWVLDARATYDVHRDPSVDAFTIGRLSDDVATPSMRFSNPIRRCRSGATWHISSASCIARVPETVWDRSTRRLEVGSRGCPVGGPQRQERPTRGGLRAGLCVAIVLTWSMTTARLDRRNGRRQVQSSSSMKDDPTERVAGLLARLLDLGTGLPVRPSHG